MFDLAPADFTKALLVGMGLVAAGMALSFALAIVLGGFKVGSLRREMTIEVPAADFATFWTQAYQRIMALGFAAEETAGHFVQGGASFLNPQSHTHAKTKKRLTVETLEQTSTTTTLRFTLAYLDPIVGDTGEGAYRDAVLDYVAGRATEMKVVPNRNYAAFSSLVGGVLALVAVPVLHFLTSVPLLIPISCVAVTEAGTAVFALVTIHSKPAELKGTGLAIGGIATSMAACLLAVVLTVWRFMASAG
jgi:hypothetical protein